MGPPDTDHPECRAVVGVSTILDRAEYRDLLGANGFAERAHVAEDVRCGGLTVWLAQAV